jgi:2-phospho-L-lactate/phosphoenolpyruvate guanylyltransferase
MMSFSAEQPRFTALIPAKPPRLGKQRLSAVPPAFRTALAGAFALDTIEAVRACPSIEAAWLVSADATLAAAADRLGVPTIADPVAAGFNAMLRAVVRELGLSPSATVAVVPADLPAMTSADLDQALGLWDGAGSAIVADARGTGTTLYLAQAADFDPQYGPDSRTAHLTAGASELPVWLMSLHQDVDDVRDLDAAIGLGIGAHTRAVLARLGLNRR